MNRLSNSIVLLMITAAAACSEGTSSPMAASSQAQLSNQGFGSGSPGVLTAGQPKVYRLKGTADLKEVEDQLCYTVDLWDIEQDRIVGTATDCLSEIDTSDPTGVVLTGRTTFDFGRGDSFTSQGRTSVRPTMPGSSEAFTHITGAVPAEGTNSVIAGEGRFTGFEATVRLSGAVDLTLFPGTATFDCLFVVAPL